MYVFLGYVYMDVYMCVCVSRAAVHVIPFLVSCGHLSICSDVYNIVLSDRIHSLSSCTLVIYCSTDLVLQFILILRALFSL